LCFEGDLCSEKRAADSARLSRLFFLREPQELSLAFMTSILLAPVGSVHSSTCYKAQKREADCSSLLVLRQDSCRCCNPRTSRECLRSFRPKLLRFKASGRIPHFIPVIKGRHAALSVRRGPPGVADGTNEKVQPTRNRRYCLSRTSRGTAGLPSIAQGGNRVKGCRKTSIRNPALSLPPSFCPNAARVRCDRSPSNA
jgi:hypothetical protein